jgi:hypothetical protein
MATPVLPPTVPSPSLAQEAVAAVVTAVGCVLLGAPVGLLWAAVTPRAQVVAAGDGVRMADPFGSTFIASDAYFLAAVLVAGTATGLLAFRLGRRFALGSVLGLAVGGLLAAEVARRTGPMVGLEEARAVLRGGVDGTVEVVGRVRATSALAVWPLAGLLAHMSATALTAPTDR